MQHASATANDKRRAHIGRSSQIRDLVELAQVRNYKAAELHGTCGAESYEEEKPGVHAARGANRFAFVLGSTGWLGLLWRGHCSDRTRCGR
eukprot:6182458-Pleurochrysis_carterae.AAC.1